MNAENAAIETSFVTTEHLALQNARAQTVAESTGRATMFLSSVSAGLVALGLMATATRVGDAFYAFALIVLPTLALIGLTTFSRALQTGVEDVGYVRRIARLRAYYFDRAPELASYLTNVRPEPPMQIGGLLGGWFQKYKTIAGMVAIVTSVLTGAAVGLAAGRLSASSLETGVVSGSVVAVVAFVAMLQVETLSFKRAALERIDDAPSGA